VRRPVPATELPFEFMLNALRLNEGFTLAGFEAATGLPGETVQARLQSLADRGLLSPEAGRFVPTESGFRFLNELQAGFLPDGKEDAARGELYTARSGLVPERDFHHIVSKKP
jgi:oxygen-independent coproporphyrinogen-3 oxidase